MARVAATLALLALIASVASAGRVLQQASAPVTAQDLTDAFSKINNFAQVPDISQQVASSTPDYSSKVAAAQGPARTVVDAAKNLTATPPSPDTPALRDALRAYGNQSGKSALSPVGQKLYDAYQGLTTAFNFTQSS